MDNTKGLTILTEEAVRAAMEGTKGVTPGPWIRSGVRHKVRDEDCLMVGPDGFSIAAVPIGRLPNEHSGAFLDAGFIAMCSPEFIRALCEDWLRQRALLEETRKQLEVTIDGEPTDFKAWLVDISAALSSLPEEKKP